MAGKTLDFRDILSEDQMACEIARYWMDWDMRRDQWKKEKVELRKYIFAVDTTTTTNSQLLWSNKTHIPKICQIRDNLIANYIASMFPKRKWLLWEGEDEDDPDQVEAIRDYMAWAVARPQFRDEIVKLVHDYVDYGNALGTTGWEDNTSEGANGIRLGYVGPRIIRINPLDIVMNPIAPTAKESPKIHRRMTTMGEAKKILDSFSETPEEVEKAQEVWSYCMGLRDTASNHGGDYKEVDEYLNVDGFTNFKEYLGSQYVELLTFVGDFYDKNTDTFYPKHEITVIDRHKIISNKPHQTLSGDIPIHHTGWRIRQDNNWAMGPLDNLIGMQYRIDHVENMKSDIFDLTAYPPLKIKGVVEDFEWGPFERIYVDSDGDVELMSPSADILTANIEIQGYEQRMEEMAGSPKEAMGIRSPGEKTAYEVQRLENAAARIFQSKIRQFEEQILEPLLNDYLALAKENLTSATIRVIDDELKSVSFRKITKEDLSALGRIKPVAARHFAEKAELVQNLNNFFQSAMGQDPEVKNHFSSIKLAEMMEEALDIADYEVVQPNVRISEQMDAQRLANAGMESVGMEAQTPAGIAEDDVDEFGLGEEFE